MTNRIELETDLLQALDSHTRVYRAAIPVAKTLATSYDLSSESQALVQELEQFMHQAQSQEEDAKALREQWASLFQGQSNAVQRASEQLAELIQQLLGLIENIEERAHHCKANLAPQVNQQLQFQKANTAYSNP